MDSDTADLQTRADLLLEKRFVDFFILSSIKWADGQTGGVPERQDIFSMDLE